MYVVADVAGRLAFLCINARRQLGTKICPRRPNRFARTRNEKFNEHELLVCLVYKSMGLMLVIVEEIAAERCALPGVGGGISLYFLYRRMIGDRHNYSTRKKGRSEAASGRRVTGGCCLFSVEICIIAIMAARIELTVVTLLEMSRDSQG